MRYPKLVYAQSLPAVLVATRVPPQYALRSERDAVGSSIVVAREPEEVCFAIRSPHSLRLILYGPDDVGAAAMMAASELIIAGWIVTVIPILSVAGLVTESDRVDRVTIGTFLALAEDGGLGPTNVPGPMIHDLPLRSRRIYVNPITGAVVVDGVERPFVQGVVARLLLYLARNHERAVSRLEPGLRTEVFGGILTRKTWNNALYRLRLALGDSRDVLHVSPNHAKIRTQRCDRLG